MRWLKDIPGEDRTVEGVSKRTYDRAGVARAVSEALDELGFSWEPGVDGEHLHLFDDLGLDSLDGFDMVLTLEEKFDVSSADENFARTFTMRSVIETACEILRENGRFEE